MPTFTTRRATSLSNSERGEVGAATQRESQSVRFRHVVKRGDEMLRAFVRWFAGTFAEKMASCAPSARRVRWTGVVERPAQGFDFKTMPFQSSAATVSRLSNCSTCAVVSASPPRRLMTGAVGQADGASHDARQRQAFIQNHPATNSHHTSVLRTNKAAVGQDLADHPVFGRHDFQTFKPSDGRDVAELLRVFLDLGEQIQAAFERLALPVVKPDFARARTQHDFLDAGFRRIFRGRFMAKYLQSGRQPVGGGWARAGFRVRRAFRVGGWPRQSGARLPSGEFPRP